MADADAPDDPVDGDELVPLAGSGLSDHPVGATAGDGEGDADLLDELDDDEGLANPLAALLGGGGGGGGGAEGGLDMGALLGSAMQMQQQLMAAREEAAAQVVEGAAGGGVVRVQVTGGMDFRSVHIDPAAVDPADVGMLEDLVLAALHDAVARANQLQEQAMGGLQLPGLGGLGGLG
jgi:DNA-binding YbaB/EbfC family protein